jgi:dienelactone hydrolase
MVLDFLFKKKEKKTNRFGTRHGAGIANQSYKGKADSTFNGHTLISENEFNKAYKNPITNEIDVGVRGTAGFSDVITDAKKLFGSDIKKSDRYKNSSDFVKKLKQENPTSKINLYGHSLGGAIVNELAKENPNIITSGEAYNPYLLSSSDASNKIKNYRLPTDVASLLAVNSENVKTVGDASDYTRGILDAHSLENFMKLGGQIKY